MSDVGDIGGVGGVAARSSRRVRERPPVPGRGAALRGVVARRRTPRIGTDDFLASVAHVAGAVRSGAAPAQAWWHGMGVRTDGGVPRWEDLVARAGSDATEVGAARAVHAAARLSAAVGTAPAAMLDRIAAGLGRDAEEAAQRRSAIAGPQTTARLLAWLPGLGVLLGLSLGADPAAVLLDGRGGTGLLVAGGVLTAIGRWWGRCYIRAAVAAGSER